MVKTLFVALFFLFSLFIFTQPADARSGCCSHHGGVCGCGCCDGTGLSATCAPYYPECSGGARPAPVATSAPKVIQPVSSPRPKATVKPKIVPSPRPTTAASSKPVASCSATSDSICPGRCTAGNDSDCCGQKAGYKWYDNWGCYPAELGCSATSNNKCGQYCTAGNDYDCCAQKEGYNWYENWGCYSP